MIKYQNVGMTYGKNVVLENIDLEIKTGELFVLVGPSGSGKTTLLRMLNQLTLPTAGDIYYEGKKIKTYDKQKLRLQMGYVPQVSSLFPNLNIEENITIQLEQLRVPKAKRKARAKELLASVDLEPEKFAKRMPDELSGGQQQRVAIIRALATDPKLILMDESFSALDPVLRRQSQDLILELHQRLQTTIVFVTHDMQEAMRLGDRIAILHEGQVQQIGTPTQIIEAPANDFVREFFAPARPRFWNLATVCNKAQVLTYDPTAAKVADFDQLLAQLTQQTTLIFNYQEQTYQLSQTQLLEFFQEQGGST
ncbi:ATP-binding cassette domain-containing protein [Ligilactobacillus apodemi]|uniref:ABC-type quaternary amine transporter n=1 Tax=Ligilactobacillus apodemi DSM 16634 = JCM 16172 TaxID=1423724 RepID=A0A0R1U6Y6_9LACO|nr:ABC transporter ATP-binding protein [Ligilactobacillus apodemi]KRL87274.1 ABC proline glycine betaine transporter ATPase [Ligilactobacillus apodemi DSM 16634 = JCM 16172]MCR1901796.1 ABC transporter ATP-binding protein [Ligilactobacillus apodemi]